MKDGRKFPKLETGSLGIHTTTGPEDIHFSEGSTNTSESVSLSAVVQPDRCAVVPLNIHRRGVILILRQTPVYAYESMRTILHAAEYRRPVQFCHKQATRQPRGLAQFSKSLLSTTSKKNDGRFHCDPRTASQPYGVRQSPTRL